MQYFYSNASVSVLAEKHTNNGLQSLLCFSKLKLTQTMVRSFIVHTSVGEAANSQCQRLHFPHSHTNGDKWKTNTIGGNVGFSVLPKDTSTCGQGELGSELLTHESLANPLYPLSHRGHKWLN